MRGGGVGHRPFFKKALSLVDWCATPRCPLRRMPTTKPTLQSLQQELAAQRREITALKRAVAVLGGQRRVPGRVPKGAPSKAVPITSLRFQARGLRSLRSRLDMSAAEFGSLIGVTGQSVYKWENGKWEPRDERLTALSELRKLGKREAHERLAKLRR